MVFTFDYYHKDIKDVLTVRATNLAFEARMPGHGNELVPGTGSTRIESFGPWGEGTYDGFTIGFQKRMSHNFTLQANYTFTHGIDERFEFNAYLRNPERRGREFPGDRRTLRQFCREGTCGYRRKRPDQCRRARSLTALAIRYQRRARFTKARIL